MLNCLVDIDIAKDYLKRGLDYTTQENTEDGGVIDFYFMIDCEDLFVGVVDYRIDKYEDVAKTYSHTINMGKVVDFINLDEDEAIRRINNLWYYAPLIEEEKILPEED